MDIADWKKLLIFGSLTGLGVWGYKWNARVLQSLEDKQKKLKKQKTPYTVASLIDNKRALAAAGEYAMVQGTCVDMETLKIKVPDNLFQNIRPTNRLYTVRYEQSLQDSPRYLQHIESVPGSL